MIDARRIEENIFKGLMLLSLAVIIFVIFFMVAVIIARGISSMNLAMVTQAPKGGYYMGKEGGVLNAILGSLYLGIGATLVSFLISLPVALYINIYLKKKSKLAMFVRFSLDVLWGVPSIVYGAFGFMIMLFFGLRSSLLGGIIAVSFLMLPIMTRSMDEVIRMIPHELLEASYSVGSTRLETSFYVVIKQTLPGILTAVLIAFGRGIGDAASVMFTAGFSDYVPYSLFKPVATLPLAIFYQLGTPVPEVQGRAYASAFILTAIILIISLISRMLSIKLSHNVIK